MSKEPPGGVDALGQRAEAFGVIAHGEGCSHTTWDGGTGTA
jgi:hypothetical protein